MAGLQELAGRPASGLAGPHRPACRVLAWQGHPDWQCSFWPGRDLLTGQPDCGLAGPPRPDCRVLAELGYPGQLAGRLLGRQGSPLWLASQLLSWQAPPSSWEASGQAGSPRPVGNF